MADDDNGAGITSEAARGAVATTVAGPLIDSVVGMSIIGSKSALKKYDAPPADAISPAEAKTWKEWADRAPDLLRAQAGQDAPRASSPFSFPLIGLGALSGIATFTKWVPGKWKWLSGGVAAGAVGSGLYLGNKASNLNDAFAASSPMRDTLLRNAGALEHNPALRQQFADYLSGSVSAQEAQSPEATIVAKAVEFGKTLPHLQAVAGKDADCKDCHYR
jgi:hypothetical protein